MRNEFKEDIIFKGPKDMRTKTTFKVEIKLDLPSCDNREWVDQRLKEVMSKIMDNLNKNDFDGQLKGDDGNFMSHCYEAFYGYDEEEEYNANDWDF